MTIKRLVLYIFIAAFLYGAFNGLLLAIEHKPFIVTYIPSMVGFLGGILSVVIGGWLYKRGIGERPDGTEIVKGNIKISVKTVGSVLMATSLGWAYIGYLTIPSIERALEATIETSFIDNPPHIQGIMSDVQQRGLWGSSDVSETEVNDLGMDIRHSGSSQVSVFGGQSSRFISRSGPPPKIDIDSTETLSIAYDKTDVSNINIVYRDHLVSQWEPEDGAVYNVLNKLLRSSLIPQQQNKN